MAEAYTTRTGAAISGISVEKYRRKVIRLVSRMVRDPDDLEDIAQETFIKAYRALPQFRGDAAFYTWLYRIAVNTAKNFLFSIKNFSSFFHNLKCNF